MIITLVIIFFVSLHTFSKINELLSDAARTVEVLYLQVVVERISEISDIRPESDYFWDMRIRLFEVKYISDIIRIRHMTIRVFVKYQIVKIWRENCIFSCKFQENFCKKNFFFQFFQKKILSKI